MIHRWCFKANILLLPYFKLNQTNIFNALKPKYNNKLPKLQQIQKIQTIIEEQLSHFSQEREIQQYDYHQEEEKKQICCEEKEIESLKEQLNRI